jgi:co-chaperonin GroES (HSP10)
MIPVYEGKLIIPETHVKKFFYGIVRAVSDDCDKSITVDSFILGEWNGNKKQIDRQNFPKIWMVDFDSVILIKKEAKWHPIGKKLMILRDNKEKKTEGGLIVTDQQRDNTQSLFGTVISLGYKDDVMIESNLKSGDYVMLTEWKEIHTEVGLYGKYMLVVREKDIACKVERV